ncbi:MAG: quinoprotein dehydrogenase-associated SoxYZ-like carrier [Pseudomonadota bacterium]
MPRKAASSTSKGPWRWFLVACIAAAGAAHGQDADPEASPIWQKVRADLFAGRQIAPGNGVVSLEVPARAQDAAIIPLTIRAEFPQTADRYIDRIWLVVDNNPSPIAAVFQFTRLSGRADIETRIRLEQYSHVRAIAVTNDGALHMASRYVKAAGGCSAPAGPDAAAAKANLGKMRLFLDEAPPPGQPALARLMISHPNASGLAMDQLSRTYAPPHFVRSLEVRYAGELVLRADVDFTISENPSFRFYLVRADEATLEARVVDNQDLVFTSSIRTWARPSNPSAEAIRRDR